MLLPLTSSPLGGRGLRRGTRKGRQRSKGQGRQEICHPGRPLPKVLHLGGQWGGRGRRTGDRWCDHLGWPQEGQTENSKDRCWRFINLQQKLLYLRGFNQVISLGNNIVCRDFSLKNVLFTIFTLFSHTSCSHNTLHVQTRWFLYFVLHYTTLFASPNIFKTPLFNIFFFYIMHQQLLLVDCFHWDMYNVAEIFFDKLFQNTTRTILGKRTFYRWVLFLKLSTVGDKSLFSHPQRSVTKSFY